MGKLPAGSFHSARWCCGLRGETGHQRVLPSAGCCLLHYCPAKEEVSAGAAVVGVTNNVLIGLEIYSIGRNFMLGTVVLVKSL